MIRPLISFTQEPTANSLMAELKDKGINAALSSESDKKKTVYTVSVDEPEHAEVIKLVEGGNFSEGAVKCPGCESIAVEFPSRARASGLANAVSVLADAVAPPEEQNFFCLNCSNEWTTA